MKSLKQRFIVYNHYTILRETVVRAYSPAEAQYIVKQRMIKHGVFEPVVDSVMSEKEEQAIMAGRDNPVTWD